MVLLQLFFSEAEFRPGCRTIYPLSRKQNHGFLIPEAEPFVAEAESWPGLWSKQNLRLLLEVHAEPSPELKTPRFHPLPSSCLCRTDPAKSPGPGPGARLGDTATEGPASRLVLY